MKTNIKHIYTDVFQGIFNSYSQVFFSKNYVFAVVLFIVSFFDLYAGLAGLMAVVFTNSAALFIGLNKEKIRQGAYGFNSLLVGLGVGIYFQPGLEFYLILLFVSLLTLFITVAFEGILGKYGLPYLSIPFLFGIWMVMIATKGYSALDISERGVYNLNDMYAIGGFYMVRLYEWFNQMAVPESLRIYFKSLSAILFQYHMFAGILIAIGLMIYSRIAFLLSLIGFFSAFYFYQLIGADISELTYSYIGFNYILTAIAVGGFFIVPSKQSILWVVLLTPLVAIMLSSTTYLFSIFGLSVFSLPFNVVVLMFLYVLKFRERNTEQLSTVTIQQYSPEQHAYSYKNYMQRFGNMAWHAIHLPFWGEWKVTQAHNGEHTHKEEWKHAWDFEIADQDGMVFGGSGTKVSEYYCFGKPVTAPADGIVISLEDGIDDNDIGDMNLEKNWGNTIVIKHDEHLYSQLSHLKKESFKVRTGQEVKAGEVIAACGNSGRSPVPHIHFQLQATPSIGSKTIDYPLSSFVINQSGQYRFETSEKPGLGQAVSNTLKNELIKKAYHFLPGEQIVFETDDNKKYEWNVKSDIYNNTFIQDEKNGSIAWFKQIGDVFFFTHYKGKQKSLLYYFFLSSYKIVYTFYPNLTIRDEYPLSIHPDKKLLLAQDFLIPFLKFLKADYKMVYSSFKPKGEKEIVLRSSARFGQGDSPGNSFQFTLHINEKGISEFILEHQSKSVKATRKF